MYGRGQLGSIRLKTSRLPVISFLAVLILCPIGSWPLRKVPTCTDEILISDVNSDKSSLTIIYICLKCIAMEYVVN